MTIPRRSSVVAYACLVLFAETGEAGFDASQLKCRQAIATSALKLADRSMLTHADCHGRRVKRTISATTDCNDIVEADTKAKIPAIVTEFGTKTAKKCSGLNSAALGYSMCPSPCNVAVSSVSTVARATDCIACLTKYRASISSIGTLGAPAIPLGPVEAACHAAIGKTDRKFFKTVLRERQICQKKAEAAGAMTPAACSGSDRRQKIAKARSKAAKSIADSCNVPGIDLFAVDSCNKILPALLGSCVLNNIDTLATSVYESFYELTVSAVTTTTVFAATTTMPMSSTTTLPGSGRVCDVTFGVRVPVPATPDSIGAIQYQVDYNGVDGEFTGSERQVQCTNLLSSVFATFSDDDENRVLGESIISTTGFAEPRDMARCVFTTELPSLLPGDFEITVVAASTPNLQPLDAVVEVTSLDCGP